MSRHIPTKRRHLNPGSWLFILIVAGSVAGWAVMAWA
jgi:hypothetical protein